jgi:steroid delta-isomerase-like uncharacterized protein
MTESPVAASAPVPAQRPLGLPVDVSAYFAGWNNHDGAAVASVVSGTYVDPTLPTPVRGQDLAAYVDGLCAAFPDLSFLVESTHVADDVVTVRWRMQGTNAGTPLPGAPATTGATIDTPGVDVITLVDGRVRDVVGYFDRQLFIEQLGFQLIPAPQDEWPVSYGVAARLDLGNTATPGAISLTWIELDDVTQFGELQDRTKEIVTALASEPAFIGFASLNVGGRAFTLTAWTSAEAAEAALARNAPHTAAVDRVFRDGFGHRGFTSLWQPHRLNHQFATCPGCARYVQLPPDATSAACECGETVDATPYL